MFSLPIAKIIIKLIMKKSIFFTNAVILLTTIIFTSCGKDTLPGAGTRGDKTTSEGSLMSEYEANKGGLIFIQAHASDQTPLPTGRIWGQAAATIDYDDPNAEKTTLTFGNLHINSHVIPGGDDSYSLSDDFSDVFDGDSTTITLTDSTNSLQDPPPILTTKIYGPQPFHVTIPQVISANSNLAWDVDPKSKDKVHLAIIYNGFHYQPGGTPQEYKQKYLEASNNGLYTLSATDLNNMPDDGVVQVTITQLSVKWVHVNLWFGPIDIPIVTAYSVSGTSTVDK